MGYMPPVYGMNMMTPDQLEIQQRIQQMEQQRQQMQYPNQISAQSVMPTQNVNWIYVAGVDGAKNQIVQPGNTAWMMDNNSPIFYVKTVDNMGSATFKAFQFHEIPLDAPTAPQKSNDYVTREEFNALLTKLGEPAQEKKEETL
mgnify:FL=1